MVYGAVRRSRRTIEGLQYFRDFSTHPGYELAYIILDSP